MCVYLFIVPTHSGASVGDIVIFLDFTVPGLHKSGVVHILGLCDKEVFSHCDKGMGLVCMLCVVCKNALVCIVLSHHCQFITPLLFIEQKAAQSVLFATYII